MLVQPQQAATVCELDPVQHTIGSSKRAQTLDSNQPPENSHETLNQTLDLEYAHVSGHPQIRDGIVIMDLNWSFNRPESLLLIDFKPYL